MEKVGATRGVGHGVEDGLTARPRHVVSPMHQVPHWAPLGTHTLGFRRRRGENAASKHYYPLHQPHNVSLMLDPSQDPAEGQGNGEDVALSRQLVDG